jgi:hypothetical protein
MTVIMKDRGRLRLPLERIAEDYGCHKKGQRRTTAATQKDRGGLRLLIERTEEDYQCQWKGNRRPMAANRKERGRLPYCHMKI